MQILKKLINNFKKKFLLIVNYFNYHTYKINYQDFMCNSFFFFQKKKINNSNNKYL